MRINALKSIPAGRRTAQCVRAWPVSAVLRILAGVHFATVVNSLVNNHYARRRQRDRRHLFGRFFGRRCFAAGDFQLQGRNASFQPVIWEGSWRQRLIRAPKGPAWHPGGLVT